MRVLILNWRDVRNPRSGGAEVVTHEIATRLVRRGHEVAWITSRSAGLPAEELVDGVRILRAGSELTTRAHAPSLARREGWDVLVEEINTLPYLSPLWSRAPSVLFIHQLARDVWWYESPRALAPIGFLAEPLYLQAYRACPKITVSASTRDDLRSLGLRGPIHIVPESVSIPPLERLLRKEPRGRLVSIGRLVPSKRPGHVIRALAALRDRLPQARLTLVGEGPERGHLERLAGELGIAPAVAFAGRVSEDEKRRLLEEADLLVACSVREGWGLTVTEAARLGTPAVTYDVPGFRDSIVDGRTGLLTEPEPVALAASVHALLQDPDRYARLREAAWRTAAELSWDRTASAFERVLRASQRGRV
jgi:glycosyltransferase involved in cell wall biosynthesis